MKLHCKFCEYTFEGGLVSGTGYGEACANCGRYSQVSTPGGSVEPDETPKPPRKKGARRGRK